MKFVGRLTIVDNCDCAKVTQAQKDKSHVFCLRLRLFWVFSFRLRWKLEKNGILWVDKVKKIGQLMESKTKVVK